MFFNISSLELAKGSLYKGALRLLAVGRVVWIFISLMIDLFEVLASFFAGLLVGDCEPSLGFLLGFLSVPGSIP